MNLPMFTPTDDPGPSFAELLRRAGFDDPVRLDQPGAGVHSVPGLPLRISGVDRWIRSPAPTLGRDNDRLLASIGVDETLRRQL